MAFSLVLLVADTQQATSVLFQRRADQVFRLLSWNVSKPPRLLIRAVSIKYWVLVSINMI
jgi:hypothetical protein